MGNSKVALLRYVKIARGWRRVRVYAIRRGRGWDERLDAPDGAEILERGQFQLRWHQGSQAVYKGAGHDLQEAITARDNQIANLDAERAATVAGRKLVSDEPGRVVLAEARQRFIQKKRLVTSCQCPVRFQPGGESHQIANNDVRLELPGIKYSLGASLDPRCSQVRSLSTYHVERV
jgi:hypothetical protein